MRKIVLSCLCLCISSLVAKANTYNFSPTPNDLGDLDHNKFYSWGLNWTVPQGQTIVGASITFNDIWDWQVEAGDLLSVHLLDTAPNGVLTYTDNEGGGDFFSSAAFAAMGIASTRIGTWTDPAGGHPSTFDLVFNFNAAQLSLLQSFLLTSGPSGWGNFGFGFDSDCHYYNNGIVFQITTQSVPDNGSTAALLAVACVGFAAVRRKLGLATSAR